MCSKAPYNYHECHKSLKRNNECERRDKGVFLLQILNRSLSNHNYVSDPHFMAAAN